MKAYSFYKTTESMLNDLAIEKGVKDLSRYYKRTDYDKSSPVANYKGLSQVFAQLALHAQNASLISNIVKFKENIDFLDDKLCGFDPKAFSEKFDNPEDIVNALRYDANDNEKGLKWDSSKNKSGKEDVIITRYANALLDGANWLKCFSSRQEFINKLKENYKGDIKKLIKFFRNKVKHGFNIALACDFLKELDESFDLPKPDRHIKDTLCALLGHPDGYYSGYKKEYECISDMIVLTDKINAELKKKSEPEITVYQLDRMIWLVCSQDFFLENNSKNYKDLYLSKINSIV